MKAKLKSGKIITGRQAEIFEKIGIAKEIENDFESDIDESMAEDTEVSIPKKKPGRKKKQ